MKKIFTSMALGSILLSSTLHAEEIKPESLKADGFYLGAGGGADGEDRKSFRNVKHYKRRKRWLA